MKEFLKDTFLIFDDNIEIENDSELKDKKVKVNAYNRSKAKPSIVEKIKNYYYRIKLEKLEKQREKIDPLEISKAAIIEGKDGVKALEKAEDKLYKIEDKIAEIKEKFAEPEVVNNVNVTEEPQIDLSSLQNLDQSTEEASESKVENVESEVNNQIANEVSEMVTFPDLNKGIEPQLDDAVLDSIQVGQPLQESSQLESEPSSINNDNIAIEQEPSSMEKDTAVTEEAKRIEKANREQQEHEKGQDELEEELSDALAKLNKEYVDRAIAEARRTFDLIRANDRQYYKRIVENIIQETETREMSLINDHNQEKSQLQSQIDSLTISYNSEKNRAEEEAKTNEENNKTIADLNSTISDKNAEIARLKEENEKLQADNNRLVKENRDFDTTIRVLNTNTQRIANAMVTGYTFGNEPQIDENIELEEKGKSR